MNKKLIIGIIIAALVVGGGTAYMLTNSSGEENPYSQQQAQQTEETSAEFNPVPTNDLAFEASATGDSSTGDFTATILFDGQGNASYSGESKGQTFEAYLADGSFIICNEGTCYKLLSAGGEVPVREDQYSYDQEDFNEFKDVASYQGREDCPAGTCDVWLVDHSEHSGTTKVFLDSNNRVSRLITDTEDGSFTISYKYKDVTIDLPDNVQEFPNTP